MMNATKKFLMLGAVVMTSAPAFAQAVPATPTQLYAPAPAQAQPVPRGPEAAPAAQPAPQTMAGQPKTYIPQQQPAPVQAQAQPQTPAAQPQPIAQAPAQQRPAAIASTYDAPSLGDSGTMFARRLGVPTQGPTTSAALTDQSAASVAAIAPAAGGEAKIVQPPLTAPVENVKPVVATTPAPAAPAIQNRPSKMLGGVAMMPTNNALSNIDSSKVLTRFASYSKTAGTDATLASQGPYTVFAPTDRAFAKLPSKALSNLAKQEDKAKLTRLLNNHIVPGVHDSASIKQDIKAAGGTATYVTMAGSTLRATIIRGNVTLIDENGNRATVTTADAYQSNGVLHALDTVLIPK